MNNPTHTGSKIEGCGWRSLYFKSTDGENQMVVMVEVPQSINQL